MGKDDVIDLGIKKGTSRTISDKTASDMLRELVMGLGYDVLSMTPQDKAVVAVRLSGAVGQVPAWTWRYVHNVLGRKIDASAKFMEAILALGAVLDGANPLMIGMKRVSVFAKNVNPGTVVLAAGRKCANPACPIEFVPRVPRQRFCSAECRRASSPSGKPHA